MDTLVIPKVATKTLDRSRKGQPMYTHNCERCGKPFSSYRQRHRFCSQECGRYRSYSTDEMYSRVDNNLPYYLNRLLHKNNHIPAKSRKNLTREHLEGLWKQQGGRCALSGEPMTFRAKKGETFPYNASIDRIVPGGPYTIDNIQLVCTITNTIMRHFSKQDFVHLCRAVADHSSSALPKK